ncbi:CPBP family intramembrane glutamic endopeptidase [Streptomyces sp. NPDC127039]|uniref:CPBP family intramembrane glutamic endopeptidase n=1 Tax=Streptomyces sp. NPDC127039 TaxID=3347115 RepID=UPI00365AAD15
MNRLLLVVAVAPAFALLLGAVIAAAVRFRVGGAGGRAAVERLAPVLYTGTVCAAAFLSAVLTGFDPVGLGLSAGPDRTGPEGWAVVAAATAAGVLAGALGYFAELLLAHRAAAVPGGGSGADGHPRGPTKGHRKGPATGTRSVGAWAGTPRALLALGLLTGVGEEVLFRGYLLTGLREALVPWAALVVQAALFGVHHASFGLRAVPAKAVHGLLWGALTLGSGSLLPAVAAHTVFQVLVCRRLTRAARPTDTRQVGGSPDDHEHEHEHDRAQGSAAVRRPPMAR